MSSAANPHGELTHGAPDARARASADLFRRGIADRGASTPRGGATTAAVARDPVALVLARLAVSDPSEDVRYHAALATGEWGGAQEVAVLSGAFDLALRHATTDAPAARSPALGIIRALQTIGGPDALSALARAVSGVRYGLTARTAAALAIREIALAGTSDASDPAPKTPPMTARLPRSVMEALERACSSLAPGSVELSHITHALEHFTSDAGQRSVSGVQDDVAQLADYLDALTVDTSLKEELSASERREIGLALGRIAWGQLDGPGTVAAIAQSLATSAALERELASLLSPRVRRGRVAAARHVSISQLRDIVSRLIAALLSADEP